MQSISLFYLFPAQFSKDGASHQGIIKLLVFVKNLPSLSCAEHLFCIKNPDDFIIVFLFLMSFILTITEKALMAGKGRSPRIAARLFPLLNKPKDR